MTEGKIRKKKIIAGEPTKAGEGTIKRARHKQIYCGEERRPLTKDSVCISVC